SLLCHASQSFAAAQWANAREAGRLWHVLVLRQAAVPLAALDLRTLDWKLRLGNSGSDRGHQRGSIAAAHLDHQVGHADAEAAAASHGHQRQVQTLQAHRSPPGRYESRAAGAV